MCLSIMQKKLSKKNIISKPRIPAQLSYTRKMRDTRYLFSKTWNAIRYRKHIFRKMVLGKFIQYFHSLILLNNIKGKLYMSSNRFFLQIKKSIVYSKIKKKLFYFYNKNYIKLLYSKLHTFMWRRSVKRSIYNFISKKFKKFYMSYSSFNVYRVPAFSFFFFFSLLIKRLNVAIKFYNKSLIHYSFKWLNAQNSYIVKYKLKYIRYFYFLNITMKFLFDIVNIFYFIFYFYFTYYIDFEVFLLLTRRNLKQLNFLHKLFISLNKFQLFFLFSKIFIKKLRLLKQYSFKGNLSLNKKRKSTYISLYFSFVGIPLLMYSYFTIFAKKYNLVARNFNSKKKIFKNHSIRNFMLKSFVSIDKAVHYRIHNGIIKYYFVTKVKKKINKQKYISIYNPIKPKFKYYRYIFNYLGLYNKYNKYRFYNIIYIPRIFFNRLKRKVKLNKFYYKNKHRFFMKKHYYRKITRTLRIKFYIKYKKKYLLTKLKFFFYKQFLLKSFFINDFKYISIFNYFYYLMTVLKKLKISIYLKKFKKKLYKFYRSFLPFKIKNYNYSVLLLFYLFLKKDSSIYNNFDNSNIFNAFNQLSPFYFFLRNFTDISYLLNFRSYKHNLKVKSKAAVLLGNKNKKYDKNYKIFNKCYTYYSMMPNFISNNLPFLNIIYKFYSFFPNYRRAILFNTKLLSVLRTFKTMKNFSYFFIKVLLTKKFFGSLLKYYKNMFKYISRHSFLFFKSRKFPAYLLVNYKSQSIYMRKALNIYTIPLQMKNFFMYLNLHRSFFSL